MTEFMWTMEMKKVGEMTIMIKDWVEEEIRLRAKCSLLTDERLGMVKVIFYYFQFDRSNNEGEQRLRPLWSTF